eukprot:CAMPEP_0167757914 /NCGR_PEP_ID=MMETSP0110_2-20121227/10185_1 /TAXON_ID=629695 /ORGANISM="Gymnochlora sp., Strain CCMP2014" /LENGTH=97 /DNA_ID=CAMNT_0007644147 /DNA_START=12 /DNA_END=305 /DNA_ORIENTATION=-
MMLARGLKQFCRRFNAIGVRGLATETIAPYPNAPEIKIQAEITRYDAVTEKRLEKLAASETEPSPYHPSNLYKDTDEAVPKWNTDFYTIVREQVAHH